MGPWLGVDVGGARKGFDVALVDERRLVCHWRRQTTEQVVALVDEWAPQVVGIDSPRDCALAGARTRDDELRLARAVCGIRWTPDHATVHGGNPYYAWIVHGLSLYERLAERDTDVIEVFPTASWTRWIGKRDGERRSAWSRRGLEALGLDGVPARTSQDLRDAIAAAVTARQHAHGETDPALRIVVPR